MKFKKYVSEGKISDKLTLTINEEYTHPDSQLPGFDANRQLYGPIEKMLSDGRFDEARAEIAVLEQELEEIKSINAKRKFFKYPKFMIKGLELNIAALKSKLPKNESVEDMHKRCERCNTLLNDMGTCPKCDDGEEDYEDSTKESTVEESIQTEELSNKEKLKRAYPELNFDVEPVVETIQEDLSVREKLLKAYPELNFNKDSNSDLNEKVCSASDESCDIDEIQEGSGISTTKSVAEEVESDLDEYDDEYELEDDVEQDRVHAALYGGDRMYCDCGEKLHFNEYGSYCPICDPQDPSDMYDDDMQ